jgi:F-type H+-transporting ATPase subunit b
MDIQLPQILFQMVNFSIVLGALTVLLYKPIITILEERSKKIEQAQRAAAETTAARDNISLEEKKAKQEAEQNASEIMAKAQQAATATEAEALERAKEKASKELEKMKAEWSEEKRQYLKEMRVAFVDAVIATSEKIISEKLDSKKHQALIDQELESLVKAL